VTETILYIGSVMSSEVQQEYDLAYYSRAADNKKRGIIASLQACDAEVTIVSPVFINNNTFQYHGGRKFDNNELGVTNHIPATVDIYGLNYLFLAITTTVLMLKLLRNRDFDAILFYDFQIETAVPALIGSSIYSVPQLLEYEDGLFFHDNTVIRWTAKVLRPICGQFIDGAVCVNEPLAELLPTDNTTIIRGFPSIGTPDELPEPTYEREETVVMFAGRFDDVRGINTFLEVAPEVKYDQDEVAFWISGYGPDHEVERVKARVEQLNDDRFSYFGTLPWEEYRKRVVSADVAVNFQDPYHEISEYTFPSKLLDFMSAHTAVISTEMSDLKKHFDDKFIIAGTSHRQLQNGLERVIETDETSETQLRKNLAREWIETECARPTVGTKILRVINNVDST